ncbi:hypothetical protein AXG93_2091s1140 [Marchantia polymorpha subsp. ruderalis]|uniref:Uncharacterized protein n=1 Tax=Marchantia polymorpha subsp. ruderalis TaxID=1480154 RepID=A0A176W6M2_MARPO|nr:hypothetical protein AXG93_2091s1140 [Marchantia polymorpha subsp. ruderalis]
MRNWKDFSSDRESEGVTPISAAAGQWMSPEMFGRIKRDGSRTGQPRMVSSSAHPILDMTVKRPDRNIHTYARQYKLRGPGGVIRRRVRIPSTDSDLVRGHSHRVIMLVPSGEWRPLGQRARCDSRIPMDCSLAYKRKAEFYVVGGALDAAVGQRRVAAPTA